MDWKIRKGEMKMMTGRKFPRGLGHDFAGVVEAVGPNVTRFKVGDEVFGAPGLKESGTFAEALVTEEKTVFLKPQSLSFEEAAALPIVSATAWNALVDKAKLQAGQRVFITGCLGGVGRVAAQIARMRGAKSPAVVARPGARKRWRWAWGRSSTIAPSTRVRIDVASTWSSIRRARCR